MGLIEYINLFIAALIGISIFLVVCYYIGCLILQFFIILIKSIKEEVNNCN